MKPLKTEVVLKNGNVVEVPLPGVTVARNKNVKVCSYSDLDELAYKFVVTKDGEQLACIQFQGGIV